MEMSASLSLRSDIFSADVQFQANRLVLPKALVGEEIHELAKLLHAIEGCSLWWMADFCIWLRDNKSELAYREFADQTSDSLRLYDAVVIADAFPVRSKLSLHFHREAFVESGRDVGEAMKWLKEAETNGWTISEMRRNVRASRRIGKEPIGFASQPSPSITGALLTLKSTMRNILKDQPIEEWDLQQLSALKADLEPILNLAAMIDQRLDELLRNN